MSTNSYLYTAELTVDLEQDEIELLETPTGAPKLSQRAFSKPEYRPLTVESVQFNVPDKILVADLTSNAHDLLENYLDIEQIGTMVNWEVIGSDLGLSMDSLVILEKNGKTRGVLAKCKNTSLNKLVKSLAHHKRIDVLYSLQELYQEERLFRNVKKRKTGEKEDAATYSNASTSLAESEPPAEKKEVKREGILIVTYSSNKKEMKEVNWMIANIKAEKFNKTNIPVTLLNEIVSDDNIEESVSRAFERAEHVIFCFSKEMLDLKNQEKHTTLAARSVSHIMRLAEQEFWLNGHKNKRFRAVIFYRYPVELTSIGWASATLTYTFPPGAEALFKKIGLTVLMS